MMLHPTRGRRTSRRTVRAVAYRVCIAEGLRDEEARCEAQTMTVPEEVTQWESSTTCARVGMRGGN